MAASPVNRCDHPKNFRRHVSRVKLFDHTGACEGDGGDEAQAARRERWCATALRFNNCVEGAAAKQKKAARAASAASAIACFFERTMF